MLLRTARGDVAAYVPQQSSPGVGRQYTKAGPVGEKMEILAQLPMVGGGGEGSLASGSSTGISVPKTYKVAINVSGSLKRSRQQSCQLLTVPA